MELTKIAKEWGTSIVIVLTKEERELLKIKAKDKLKAIIEKIE